MRCLALLLPLLLVACNDAADPSTPEDPKAAQTRDPRKVASPTTGISDVQDGHDSVKAEIRKLEERKGSGEPVEEWLVRNQLKMIDNLIRACELAIPREARLDVQREYGRLRQKESGLIRSLGETGVAKWLLTGAIPGTAPSRLVLKAPLSISPGTTRLPRGAGPLTRSSSIRRAAFSRRPFPSRAAVGRTRQCRSPISPIPRTIPSSAATWTLSR